MLLYSHQDKIQGISLVMRFCISLNVGTLWSNGRETYTDDLHIAVPVLYIYGGLSILGVAPGLIAGGLQFFYHRRR